MVAIPLFWKVIIFVALLIAAYIVLRMNDLDPFQGVMEAVTEIEWNPMALILTLLFSFIFWVMLWKTPWWATTVGAGLVTSFGGKLAMTVLLPIVGYPLAVRSLNKD